MNDDLPQELQPAKEEDASDGVPAGILIGFEDPEAWWEELLLRDPHFRARVEQARVSLREAAGRASRSYERNTAVNLKRRMHRPRRKIERNLGV
jgi:hypothetical protein